jgi:cell division protein FtsQ
MDDRGRLAQPLKRAGHVHGDRPARAALRRPRGARSRTWLSRLFNPSTRLGRLLHRHAPALLDLRVPRGVGAAASVLLIAASAAYGAVAGGHLAAIVDQFNVARDAAANAAGLRIAGVALAGNRHVTREEVLAITGITGQSSLLFLDVDAARAKLKTNPWIADATLLKLYPDRLQISLTEREGFALWQKDGRVSVIADDGTVLEPYVARRFVLLPLVVGRGAQAKAKELLALLDRYPDIRSAVRASVLVAERRWNLRLKNGIDVRLPETEIDRALDTVVALDREKKLLARDVTAIDLRLADRVTLRLSDEAAKARDDAFKDKTGKRKAGDA